MNNKNYKLRKLASELQRGRELQSEHAHCVLPEHYFERMLNSSRADAPYLSTANRGGTTNRTGSRVN